MAFRFEGLEIFHAAIDFRLECMKQSRSFPRKNDSISHRKRAVAADSIVLNICRGLRKRNKEGFFSLLRYGSRLNL
jgi:hypothetical protein